MLSAIGGGRQPQGLHSGKRAFKHDFGEALG